MAAEEGLALSPDSAAALRERPALTPVMSTAPMGGLDPVTAFKRISPDGRGFILEGRSHEAGEGRHAYVGAESDGRVLLVAHDGTDPAQALREALSELKAGRSPGLPEFVSGAIGYVGYEAVQVFEPSVAPLPAGPSGFPLAAFFLPKAFLVFGRYSDTVTAVALAGAGDGELARAKTKSESLLARAFDPDMDLWERTTEPVIGGTRIAERRMGQSQYEEMVRRARREIERGELIQVVLSQRIERQTSASPIAIYEQLRSLNPSTYMFMLNFGDFALVGASPELMTRSRGGIASIHPIAGTRPRGETPEEDAALEAELLVNEKERAEHVMLVDLARNDLGRVSQPGTVRVDSFMATERYSHVMHLVSRVTGRLRDGMDGLDAFVAGFPIGTLCGAPRLRAVELIAELEREGRGPYCGGVGWFDASGDVDTGTVIRSVALKDGVAHIQGGGIVFDSDPELEYLESLQKMKAALTAVDRVERVSCYNFLSAETR